MSNIFLVSDTHFGHSNILNFKNADGSNLRTFDSVEHMDEHMIAQWNKVVKPSSKVYHLGDVVINKKHLVTLNRLNGTKVLIRGNHDIEKVSAYTPYFKDVRGSHQFEGLLLSHIPIHPSSLGRWGVNVHGHTHSNKVMIGEIPDIRYQCVSVEQLDDYTPISLEQLKARIKNLGLIK